MGIITLIIISIGSIRYLENMQKYILVKKDILLGVFMHAHHFKPSYPNDGSGWAVALVGINISFQEHITLQPLEIINGPL